MAFRWFKRRKKRFYTHPLPDGKPTVTMAYNTSSTSIHISWRAPHKSTIHGEFLGYRISYRPREKADDDFKEIYIRDSNVDDAFPVL
ncbi:conserved hypothetical protein [Pediculus humanus corporis]|uniref:Fibronectin type-III domain-containing protein n=1 Tax=Pediculus humanus subsp. corporis TaxID=121224 RepID=E0VZ58_PEDHC|nr:uncharacterized protein Phum_PHUM527010 [Pediculus humanus corporis]EEB18664.1 conserved hypothetical protein [Pediculus humanus corporis]